MLVREAPPLEPGVRDNDIYVRGIGTVRERTVKGGRGRFELVSIRITKPPTAERSGKPGRLTADVIDPRARRLMELQRRTWSSWHLIGD